MTAPHSRMAAEIAEQPAAVAATFDALLPLCATLRDLVGERRLMFIGRGSSDNAAEYGRYLAEVHAHRSASAGSPSVATHYRADLDLRDVAVVCVSQSGATDEIVETQRWAAAQGARTIAVTNVEGSPLASEANIALVTRAGPELAVPATKTYTTQAAAMLVLGTAIAPRPADLDRHIDALPAEIERLVLTEVPDELLDALADATSWLAVGRGLLAGTAKEIGLKLEETCGRPVRGMSYADLRHGPVAFVDSGTAAIVVGPHDGPVVDGIAAMARDLSAAGATTIALGGAPIMAECRFVLPATTLPETVAPVAAAMPGQVLVEALARRLGHDPDAPAGLAKVTRTD